MHVFCMCMGMYSVHMHRNHLSSTLRQSLNRTKRSLSQLALEIPSLPLMLESQAGCAIYMGSRDLSSAPQACLSSV